MNDVPSTSSQENCKVSTEMSIPAVYRGLIALIREPLVHFLLIGAFIFGVYTVFQPTETTHQILISPSLVNRLATAWETQWRKPPTASELASLIETYLKEEIFYREAINMGLDQDDLMIRRWLAQKLDFLSQDMTPPHEPTDNELRAYFEAHQGEFRELPKLSFRQIFFNPDQRGENTQEDAEKVLKQLKSHPSLADGISALGDRFSLNHDYILIDPTEVAQLFGNSFADTLFALKSDQWQGPIYSEYGWHLVKIDLKIPEKPANFAENKDDIRSRLKDEQRAMVKRQFYQQLRDRYTIQLDQTVSENYPYIKQFIKENG